MALVKSDINLKVSIITVCFNSVTTIENTILSVANQEGVEVEHIIIDGASTDGTLDIISKHTTISKLISERDKGIYDAMNKGLDLATGDIVGFLNADDFYAGSDILSKIALHFQDSKIDACYGDLVYVEQQNTDKIVRYWKSRSYQQGIFKAGWMPAHPTFFTRKSIYDQYGGFNLDYRIAADFEMLFRLIEQRKILTVYIPEIIVKMRMGGTTNNSIRNIFIQNQEIIQILRHGYGHISTINFVLMKVASRLVQFLSRPI